MHMYAEPGNEEPWRLPKAAQHYDQDHYNQDHQDCHNYDANNNLDIPRIRPLLRQTERMP